MDIFTQIMYFFTINIIFSAERRQSMGFDWHRECLKCEECNKVLNPGQHAEVSLRLLNNRLAQVIHPDSSYQI